jgi:hypothetical protein
VKSAASAQTTAAMAAVCPGDTFATTTKKQ